ncbi:MAG: pyrroloquinoline quinone-dependent dehydrogenase, partial [Gemmatimonadaceae bacterium]
MTWRGCTGAAVALLPWLALPAPLLAQNANWPVYHGNDEHTHYTTLSQITPANVKRLTVAWTFDTKDAFPGSEMQANPIIIDGVLYATTPK